MTRRLLGICTLGDSLVRSHDWGQEVEYLLLPCGEGVEIKFSGGRWIFICDGAQRVCLVGHG